MESPQLAAQFNSAPRGRAGGQQPSTMYHDLTRAISDIFGGDDKPQPQPQGPHYASHSQLSLDPRSQQYASRSQLSLNPGSQYASRSQLSVANDASAPSAFASKTSLAQPDAAYFSGSTTSLNDPSKGYHYKRRQHSDELCTLSKPMTRRSVSDAPYPRPMITASSSYPPPRPTHDTQLSKRPSYPPTSSDASSSPEILTPPNSQSKGRRKMPPIYVASYAEPDPAGADYAQGVYSDPMYAEQQYEEPDQMDPHQAWTNDYTELTDFAQSPTAAMFPKKMSIVEPAPLAPTAEPVIYDKDYAQLERTGIVTPQGPPSALSTSPPLRSIHFRSIVRTDETASRTRSASDFCPGTETPAATAAPEHTETGTAEIARAPRDPWTSAAAAGELGTPSSAGEGAHRREVGPAAGRARQDGIVLGHYALCAATEPEEERSGGIPGCHEARG
ncbi:hypothetical protein A1Q1_01990 [Trichosporon asahii var. asahii CBS 2479]|uniref:Uncharacterized protein n=1 Tax=Trichosporon asahii var. asahii (strain ATCC 90039 / CBS 2479 / JCM 2466 / KCTC 7840 / NBRC 103889/ NCYC 2677 / UAMH 7654) TaxID=1186058 RepID=J4UCW6_TRIAS|nr:hypothetical protein A1Q1_01990 [Trichosporon asahii var. asahii CBS 2479]EJT48895.1 hypothetical protein A1Q1_01990 [Trichosporon asahii var. asahii CBS 2479]